MEQKQKKNQQQSLNQTLESSFEQNAQINSDSIFPGTILKPTFANELIKKKAIKGKSFKQIQSEIQKVQTKATVKMQQFDHKRFQKYLEEINKENFQRQSEISNQLQSIQENSNDQGVGNYNQNANKGQNQNSLEQDKQNLFYKSIVQDKKLQQSNTQELINDKKQSQAVQDLQFFVKQNKEEQNQVKVLKDDQNTNFLKQELDRIKKRNSQVNTFGSIAKD